MRRGFDRYGLEVDPAEVVATPAMVPAYATFSPRSLLCLVLVAIVSTLCLGGAYTFAFWSAGSSNKLVDTLGTGCPLDWTAPFDPSVCTGADVLRGAPVELTFGNATAPMEPFMRWLRVSLVIYPKVKAGCDTAANVTQDCLVPAPSHIALTSVVLHKSIGDTDWAELKSTTPWELELVECLDRNSQTAHPAWPTGQRDPLGGGRHSHCYVFSVAYEEGLHHELYAARISLATAAPAQPTSAADSFVAPEDWIREVVYVQTHGTVEHGYAEFYLRLVAVVTSVITFALYARAMHRYPLLKWLPQQAAIYCFSLAICGYNNPSYLVMMPLGYGYTVLPAIFDIAFYSAGLLLATVLAEPERKTLAELPRSYWTLRVAIAVMMLAVGLVQYAKSQQDLEADPSFRYQLQGTFLACAVVECATLAVWVGYVIVLLFRQLGSHAARIRANKQELAFSAATAFVVLALWVRESLTFKVYSRDYMSDVAFKYRSFTVIMCNVFARAMAVCYSPSAGSELLRVHGGIERALGDLIGLRSRTGGGGARGDGADPEEPSFRGVDSAADAVRVYVEQLRRAHSDGTQVFTKEELHQHVVLRRTLEQIPQTRGYVRSMAWVYPTLGFASNQEYLWAIVLNDLDDAATKRRLKGLVAQAHDAAVGVTRSLTGGRPADADGSPERHPEPALVAAAAVPDHQQHHEGPNREARDSSPSKYWRGGDVASVASYSTAPDPESAGEGAAREVLRRVRRVGLSASLHRAPVGAPEDGFAYVILIGESAAVQGEFERSFVQRLLVEEALEPELPAITTADKITAIARILTEQADLGDRHLPIGDLSFDVDGLPVIRASFPLHDRDLNAKIEPEWGLMAEVSEAHLRLVRDHYGEELAWYFALLDFSVEWLFPVAVGGFLVELVKLGGDKILYEVCWVVFGSALTFWGALFVVFWRRRAAELRHDWRVESLLKDERRNPSYRGGWYEDSNTGLQKPRVNNWNRLPAFANTAFQMLLQVLLLTAIEYISYIQYVWACEKFDGYEDQYFMYLFMTVVVNSTIYIGGIMFGQYVLWSKVAAWCTTKENWAYQSQYDTQYVYYLFLFIWLDGYFWSWFFGYIHIPLVELGVDLSQWNFPIFGYVVHRDNTADYWMKKHDTMVASMLGMNQIFAFCFENVWPLILVRIVAWRLHGRRAASVGKEKKAFARQTLKERQAAELSTVQTVVPLSSGAEGAAGDDAARLAVIQALDEEGLPAFTTQDDYYDVVLFIGYIATYTVVWPLTPVVCYLNNQLELRTDLIKINNAFRRLVPKKVRGIGAWESCIVFSVWAAIPMVVTFATISSRTAEIFFLATEDPEHPAHSKFWNEDGHVRWWWRILVCFLWEHILAFVCFMIYLVTPTTPKWVQEVQKATRSKLAKQAHQEEVEKLSYRDNYGSAAGSSDGKGSVATGGVHPASTRLKNLPGRLQSLHAQLRGRRPRPTASPPLM